MKACRVFKRTHDQWYGNYKIVNDKRVSDLVEVSFLKLSDNTYRCCVWGNDDMGLEFDNPNEAIVWSLFLQIIGWDYVQQQPLRELGFVPA